MKRHTMRGGAILLALAMLSGCATSDYGRITNKMAEYEANAARDKQSLDASKDKAEKLVLLTALVRNTELQLKIARRINPESNPQYRSGKMDLAACRADKEARVAALETRLAEYLKQRDALNAG
ncbi:MAG: hypothetical protein ACKPEA_01700 [Planctomycetota bacterium]